MNHGFLSLLCIWVLAEPKDRHLKDIKHPDSLLLIVVYVLIYLLCNLKDKQQRQQQDGVSRFRLAFPYPGNIKLTDSN